MASNPDPAETYNVVDVVKALFAETQKGQVDNLRRALVTAQSSPTYENRTFGLSVGQPVLLLGFDMLRARALVRANTSDVFIGSLSELQSGFGYPLPVAAGDEIKTTDEIYVRYNPSGTPNPAPMVAVWVERNN